MSKEKVVELQEEWVPYPYRSSETVVHKVWTVINGNRTDLKFELLERMPFVELKKKDISGED